MITTSPGFAKVAMKEGWVITAVGTYVWDHTPETGEPHWWRGQDFSTKCTMCMCIAHPVRPLLLRSGGVCRGSFIFTVRQTQITIIHS